MGRKRGRCEAREVNETRETEEREVDRDSGEEADETELVKGFFACYLLCSLSPRHKGRTYIGFTVNPQRRIKQHNGEKRCGAWKTQRGRPWEMVLCIYGFPSNISALQFEWAWQHPRKSLAVREAASSFKSLSGLANKIKLAYTMLNLPSWENLSLTVNFLSTKYTKHIAGCPKLPNQMRFNICSMDDLPCYVEGHNLQCSNDDYDEDDGENLATYDCEQPLQIEEPQNLPESSKSTEEYYGNLSYSSRILLHELSEFTDLPQSPKRVIESRRRASTSLSPNSCGENVEMEQVSLKSTPKSSDDSSRILLQELSEFSDLSQSPKRVIETRRASTSLSPNSCGEIGEMEQVRLKSTPRSSLNEEITDRFVQSPEVDMINLCTPSSGIIRSKTKRALFDSTIIDLTDSPMVIQL